MKLICICGPTATGKTSLAFNLAKHFNAEIISFDSVQVYKELDIGTAKPPKEMLNEIRHHLIDEIEPDKIFTAGDFRRRALEILQDSEKPFILVGGTGFYLQALLKGMYENLEVSSQVRQTLADRLKNQGLDELYAELCRLDPEYGKKIHPHDQYRILRAFEVMESSDGKTMSQIRSEFNTQVFPFETLLIGLNQPREKLKKIVEERSQNMIQEGLIDETKSLIQKYGEGLRPLESVGYKETVSFLKGEVLKADLAMQITKSTMALAKRQTTWFKRDKNIHWFDSSLGLKKQMEEVLRLI